MIIPSWQVYEDAVEMQRFFIKIRDEICKNGEILLSPALSYTPRHLMNTLDKQKKEKLPKEVSVDLHLTCFDILIFFSIGALFVQLKFIFVKGTQFSFMFVSPGKKALNNQIDACKCEFQLTAFKSPYQQEQFKMDSDKTW